VTAFNLVALKNKVRQNGGKLKFKLDGTEVELTHGEDFFFSALEMETASQ
jgi:hypothetical protein